MATRKPARPGDLVVSNADTEMIADLLRAPPVSAKELGLLEGIKANLGIDTQFHRMDDAGHYCRVSAMLEWRELRVVYLLPRGASRGVLAPVFRDAIHDAMANRAYHNWKLWGSFETEGLIDGGRDLCLAWQELLPGTTVALRDEGFWEVYWTLAETDAVLQGLVLPGG